MGILDKVKGLLGGGGPGGGKRPSYRTRTEDGREILIDSQEAVIGNSEATSFFTDLCGGSLKEVMMRAGASNVPMPDAVPGAPAPARPGSTPSNKAQLDAFRRYGVRVSDPSDPAVYAKPGTYPHVDLKGGSVAEVPSGGGPLVISSSDDTKARKNHATVVFTVFDLKRRGRQKQVTVHFHGGGTIRAKGFMRDVGAMGRPAHYDGEEVQRLLNRKARSWAKRIYWCSSTERY